MTLITHLSDLHFGRTDQTAVNALTEAIEGLSPDATVVTGDLTQSGRRSEFEAAAAFLETLNGPVAIVPGNHDTPVYNLLERFVTPWRRFEKHFGSVAPRAWDVGDISIIGVNSARRAAPRLNWSFGKLRRSDIERAAAMAELRSQRRFVLLATHHPFRLGPGPAGSEMVGRADMALEAFSNAGVSAMLTGHVHHTSAEILPIGGGAILSLASGSATSTRQRTENASFSALSIEPGNQTSLLSVQYTFSDTAFRPAATISFVNEGGEMERRQ